MNKTVLMALVIAALPSCRPRDACGPAGATRCWDEVAQVCESDGSWIWVLDCRELGRAIGEPTICASAPYVTADRVEETHTCVLVGGDSLVVSAGDR